MVWIKFVICIAIIFIAGTRLSKYGDIIADKTGLGRVWIGTILLAAVTSLPELVVGINSVTVIDKPDLTVGNLLGASLFNLVAIAYMDIMYRQGPLLYYVSPRVALSAVAGGLLIALVGASIYISHNISPMGIANYIGIYSPILFILYLFIYQMLARYEKSSQSQTVDESATHSKHQDISSKKVYIFFALASLAIIGAGTWLSFLGDEISEITGLRASFVGTLFMAGTTSLPELIVSVSALRLKALDMAVGNVVGSNLFNMGFILFIDDLCYTKGPLLANVSQTHVFTALIALMMSCIVTIGLIFRPRFWPRSWVGFDGVALLVLYIAAFYALYLLGSA